MPLKNCVTEFRFCLDCRHFTVRQEPKKKVYDCSEEESNCFLPHLLAHCLCDKQTHTLTRYLPREEMFSVFFFFFPPQLSPSKRQKVHTNSNIDSELKNVGKKYKPKLTTTENKLKKIKFKTNKLVAESHTVRVQSSSVRLSTSVPNRRRPFDVFQSHCSGEAKASFIQPKERSNGIKFENKS